MRRIIFSAFIVVLSFTLMGCQQGGVKELFVVDFKPDTTLKYKLVSERNMRIDFDSKASKTGKSKPQEMYEKLALVIAYKPIEVDPFGLTTIEAKCQSARVTRRKGASIGDAVESLAGESFTFQISPTGKMTDYSDIKKLVRRLGNKAFLSDRGRGRIKNPDMILDFVALQGHLWDGIAAIEKPLEGVSIGQNWKSKQLVPLPIPFPTFRETTYTLGEIMQTQAGRKAVINSSYRLSDSPLDDWPNPFEGKFRMKGMFGFLRNYKYLSLKGGGKQIFSIDTGIIQSQQQQYKMEMGAEFMLPLGDSKPMITIDQKIAIQLLKK